MTTNQNIQNQNVKANQQFFIGSVFLFREILTRFLKTTIYKYLNVTVWK